MVKVDDDDDEEEVVVKHKKRVVEPDDGYEGPGDGPRQRRANTCTDSLGGICGCSVFQRGHP